MLPARAGEVIRPYLLARQEGLSATATFATIIIERVLDAVTCVFLLASFVLLFDPGMDNADSRLYWLLELGGVIVGSLAVVTLGAMFVAARDPAAAGRWAYKLEHLLPGKITHKLAQVLLKFSEGLAVVRTPRRLALALALSFPLWLSIGWGIWSVTRAFGIEMPFTGSFLQIALLVVGVSVPTPGGVGGFEAAVQIGLTSFYGVPNDRAVGAALVLHAVSLLPTVVLGFLFLLQDGLGFGGMRTLRMWPRGQVMKCPYCAHLGDKVVDSRESREGEVIRRRRECLGCGKRFTSYERIDEIPYMVVKKDGTRERFERQKLIAELLKACEKRPVSVASLEAVADRVESTLQERAEKEITTNEVGAFVMQELKKLDKVAYVRFASVYRHFRDIGEFMTELKDLLNAKE